MRASLILAIGFVSGCGKSADRPAQGTGSAAVADVATPTVKLVGCSPAVAAPRGLDVEPKPLHQAVDEAKTDHRPRGGATGLGGLGAAPAPEPIAVKQWTPYATAIAPPQRDDVATAVGAAITGKLGQLQLCFGSTTGSVRAMVRVNPKGTIVEVRSGGIGDAKVESCVTSALVQLEVGAPKPEEPTEIEVACDLANGAPQALRVTEAAGYAVVSVGKTSIQYNGQTLALDAAPPAIPKAIAHLVLAEPEAPFAAIEHVLAWTAGAPATLVAVREGTEGSTWSRAAFVGLARAVAQPGEPRPPAPVISVGPRSIAAGQRSIACLGSTPYGTSASSGDTTALDASIALVTSACRKMPCAPYAMIEGAPDATVADLAAGATAARRAGYKQITFGARRCVPAE